ncbi:MAG: Dephospho-CoA kinase-like protein [Candidatus Gottesmanbacteria bacterium GW2011_GWA1_34_13]|uniref:Dephospho-CoA kinase-like protein n=1 Tax=Candidatus Gottesmanbacteria bacterium GW2011_GWA1_34_13 TaxID=1618434 RepID=A0A0G0ASE9_9BACT|nr:MAG: Dephospho-CoA kinase-like protein [Candidatus Gottesmanbacteria bacterium GW2011_GWA1_34_13]
MPGAGKTVAADFFRKNGLSVLRFGDQTDIGLKELGKEINEKNERWYRENIRQELGMAAMAIKIEPRILEHAKKNNLIILDGLYSWEEYLYLIKKFPNLKLLCIYAPPHIRHKRLKERIIRSLTDSEAKTRDITQITNLNTGGPIAIADYLIINAFNLEKYTQALEKFYQKHK